MSRTCALLLCLLCLSMASEASAAAAAAIPINVAIIVLAAIAAVYFFISIVLLLLVCWCCCGRGKSKCSKVLPANPRARKNSYSTSPPSTELDSLSSKRTSTDLSSHSETQGDVIVRAVSKEYLRQGGEKITYTSTRSTESSIAVVETPHSFLSSSSSSSPRKPAEPLPYRTSPLLNRRVAWSDLEPPNTTTTNTTSSNDSRDKARDSTVVSAQQQPAAVPPTSDHKLCPELLDYAAATGGADVGALTIAAESLKQPRTIENQHARDVEYDDDDDVFAPWTPASMNTDLSLSLKEAAGQEVAVPPATSKKQPVARTDSTMPLLEEHSEPTTPATAVSPSLPVEQTGTAQHFKKTAGRTNSTKPLLDDSSPESSYELESPDAEADKTNTHTLKEVQAPPAAATSHKKRQVWATKLPPLESKPPSHDIARPRPGRMSAQARLGAESGNTTTPPKAARTSAHEMTGGAQQPLKWRDSLPFEGRIVVQNRINDIEEKKASQDSDGSLTQL